MMHRQLNTVRISSLDLGIKLLKNTLVIDYYYSDQERGFVFCVIMDNELINLIAYNNHSYFGSIEKRLEEDKIDLTLCKMIMQSPRCGESTHNENLGIGSSRNHHPEFLHITKENLWDFELMISIFLHGKKEENKLKRLNGTAAIQNGFTITGDSFAYHRNKIGVVLTPLVYGVNEEEKTDWLIYQDKDMNHSTADENQQRREFGRPSHGYTRNNREFGRPLHSREDECAHFDETTEPCLRARCRD